MNVEIAICTWNRSRLLHRTLESISLATLPPDVSLRVIVINNNSTDDTTDVVSSFQNQLNVQCIDEPRQGHSISRNRAIRHANGDLLIWTDDDVIVDSNWVAAYVQAARHGTENSFWGGPIIPRFEADEPNWIRENWDMLSGCFAARDLGADTKPLTRQCLPYGANFAIRTPIQKQLLFDEELGRKPTEVYGEDELHLFGRLLDSGNRGAWIPGARLHHVIEAARTTEDYVRRYFVGQGRALAAKGEAWSNDAATLSREAKWETACYRIKRHFTPSETWLSHMIRGALAEGQFLALAR